MKKGIPGILFFIGGIMKLLIATTNLHKILELKTMLKETFSNLDIYSLRDFKDYVSPEETGDTFEANAELKAIAAAKKFDMVSISDDSGLVVPALKGAPGVHSARYAGKGASDKDNMLKLLDEMKGLENDKRNAYYYCALTLASPEKIIKTVSGMCEGRILEQPKGAGGFGYDPLFLKHDYSQTFGEVQFDVKQKVSHRRRAFEKIIHTMESQFHCTTS